MDEEGFYRIVSIVTKGIDEMPGILEGSFSNNTIVQQCLVSKILSSDHHWVKQQGLPILLY